MRSRASLITIALTVGIVGALFGAAPATATPARIPAVAEAPPVGIPIHYIRQNAGYVTAVDPFGITYTDYYWEETQHAVNNYSAWPFWADIIQIADSTWRQHDASLLDDPGWAMMIPAGFCHPVNRSLCYTQNTPTNQQGIMVLYLYGWYDRCGFMRIIRTPSNQLGWTMVRRAC